MTPPRLAPRAYSIRLSWVDVVSLASIPAFIAFFAGFAAGMYLC